HRRSWEESMQEPARRLRRAVKAFAIEPEATTVRALNPVIVTRLGRILVSPPFRLDPLRTVGEGDTVLDAPPFEGQRRVVRYRCDRFDRLGDGEKRSRAGGFENRRHPHPPAARAPPCPRGRGA